MARYVKDPSTTRYCLQQILPTELEDRNYSDTIQAISKDFCEIDNQAHKCELLGLTLVAGPGYRKALEFLVKDYVSDLFPDKKAEIQKLFLGACIDKFVKNENVKLTASRAVWLGNDETHYIRKWEDKDLQDLKRLIELTKHWIEMEELTLTKDVAVEMPEGKK